MDCSCDYDCSAVWDSRIVKARKDHQCTECRGKIPRGQTYERIGSLYDGRWETYRNCGDCRVLICDMGKAIEAAGGRPGCFCYCGGSLLRDAMYLVGSCTREEKKAFLPVFAAFNAASRERGGRLFDMRVFAESNETD